MKELKEESPWLSNDLKFTNIYQIVWKQRSGIKAYQRHNQY